MSMNTNMTRSTDATVDAKADRRRTAPASTPGPTGARTGTAWTVAGAALAVAGIAWLAGSTTSLLAHRVTTRTTTFAATEITTVRVRTDTGSIRVVTRPGSQITVTARISEGLARPDDRQTVAANTLTLDGECPGVFATWCAASYSIEVPPGVAVDLGSDTGDVSTSGVTGDVRASTATGDVDVDAGEAATVTVRSDTGDVHLRNVSPATAIDVATGVGDVLIEVPDGATAGSTAGADTSTYDVSVSTDSGDRDVQVRTDPSATRTIRVVSDVGDVTVRYGAAAG